MKLLLDAHTLIWAADDPAKLSAGARSGPRPVARPVDQCGDPLGDRDQVRPGKAFALLAIPRVDGQCDGRPGANPAADHIGPR